MGIANFVKSLAASRNAVADALDGLDILREQIADATAEISRIAAAPQPVEDALAAFDAWASRAATAGVDALRVGNLLHSRGGEGLALPKIVIRPATEGGVPAFDYSAATEALLGLLVATAMPELRRIVAGQLADLTVGRETMSQSTRAKKLAQAEVDLLGLELAEEGAIRAMEAAGLDVARRSDADPRALLAADASLPN